MTVPGKKSRRTRATDKSTKRQTCKTCQSCRIKKVRCCGSQPKCIECTTDELECVYPRDARREPRPSRERVKSLESAVAAMLEQMKTAGLAPVEIGLEDWITTTGGSGEMSLSTPRQDGHQLERHPQSRPEDINLETGDSGYATATNVCSDGPLLPSSHSPQFHQFRVSDGISSNDAFDASVDGGTHLTPSSSASGVLRASQNKPLAEDKDRLSGLSPVEAHVAGISHEDGCIQSVHGLASVMNHSPGKRSMPSNQSSDKRDEVRDAATKARLMGYAALQSQRQAWVYNQPHVTIDLDGVDSELAKYLIDTHFNMQHFAYLISYRPAIVDSLASGGGPWCNKLLLNAIYYSSCLYCDRPSLHDDPKDPQSNGNRFYNRFFQLVGEEITRPSIPTAVGLLLMSASLVSNGRSSVGWHLSGLAYRMVVDLGCHLTPEPDGHSQSGNQTGSAVVLNKDIEQEMRKRLYWGAFATDATQSLYLGRPCMLAPVEARVPFEFLDTFEELEKWEPYLDPEMPRLEPTSPYTPQPAHAVSAFGAVAQLLQTSTKITQMYGIGAVRRSAQEIQSELSDIEGELRDWSDSLPSHLRFDPNAPVPPPHRISHHTTYHALNILLHRAFLEDGHLSHCSNDRISARSEEACIQSALMIETLLRCFRDTFTLRIAPFLICYATYSAVIVVLRQERHHRGQYLSSISFFWKCLSELQRGCNFGMTKPLAILSEMVREYDISIKHGTAVSDGRDGSEDFTSLGLDQSFFDFPLPTHISMESVMPDMPGMESQGGMSLNHTEARDQMFAADLDYGSFRNPATPGPMTYLDEQEQHVWQDTLYGLFTSSLPFGG